MAEVIKGKTFEEIGLNVGSKRGQFKVKHCPQCKINGHKSDNDYSVSVNSLLGVARCWKCSTRYILENGAAFEKEQPVEFVPPARENITMLSDEALKVLTDRKITQEAIDAVGLVQEKGFIMFPYYKDGQLVNAKYRGIKEKRFGQTKGGQRIIYNYDNCKGKKNILITEGEMDVLSVLSTGLGTTNNDWGICSVDSGAPNANDENVEGKLKCITNSYDIFEDAELIYIAVDGDVNGERLQRELIRRFEKSKIKIVQFDEEYKDANDVLKYCGWEELKKRIENATDYTPEGIYTFDNSWEDIVDTFENGLPEGSSTYHPSIDTRWKWRGGDVNVLTGYNNDGKSTLVLNLCILKAIHDEWSTAMYSPESLPIAKFFMKNAAIYNGKAMKKGYHNSITKVDLNRARKALDKMMYLVHPREAKTLDALFERFEYLVRRYGTRIVVIDPLNTIEGLFRDAISIDQGMSDLMGRLKQFATDNDVAVILVAHQNPGKKDANGNYEQPGKYRIKNGGTISDKADNVLMLWRENSGVEANDPEVTFISEKLKDNELIGERGSTKLIFDFKSNRYRDSLCGLDEKAMIRTPFDIDVKRLIREIERSKKDIKEETQEEIDARYGRNFPKTSEEVKEMQDELPF